MMPPPSRRRWRWETQSRRRLRKHYPSNNPTNQLCQQRKSRSIWKGCCCGYPYTFKLSSWGTETKRSQWGFIAGASVSCIPEHALLYAAGEFLDGYFERLIAGYSNDESMITTGLEVGTSLLTYGMPDCGAANLVFDATVGLGMDMASTAAFTTYDTQKTANLGAGSRSSGGGIPSGYNSRKTSFVQLSIL